jgi:transcriptional regulator with XRE-family HTH domain
MEFAKNLTQLMKERKITQATLADAIGYSQRSVSKWMNGQAEPCATAIYSCALFFDVTADYLLGLEDELGNKVKPSTESGELSLTL